MTIIVFLIDNSASMNQQTYLGRTLLDIAKGCVETIAKIRQKYSRGDRYFLMTLENEPHHIKLAGWKPQNFNDIHSSLDLIKADGLTSLGSGLKRVFDMLNLNRMHLGYENYALGRYPSQFEPAIVICITDGRRTTTEDGVGSGSLNLPMLDQRYPWNEYTQEPFRWDYRLYGLVLRFPAIQDPSFEVPKFIPTDDESPINSMCEVTGGRAYKIMNDRMLHQCLESLSQKCQPGVVVHFMKLPEGETNRENPPKWHSCKKMIFVKMRTSNSTWPIPEAYWPDSNTLTERLIPRTAHPNIRFSTAKQRPPRFPENFPIDRYELEPSPLTQYILERRDATFVWQCYIPHSGKDRDYPFGYLKASSDLMTVSLNVLPYNYPVLMDLLIELSETHKMRLNEIWGSKFGAYLGQIPSYYYQPLTKAFEKLGIRAIIKAEAVEQVLPYNLKHHLQKLRHMAKVEFDRFNIMIENNNPMDTFIQIAPTTSITQRSDFAQIINDFGDNLAGVGAMQQHQKQCSTLDIRAVNRGSAIQNRNLKPYEDVRHISRHHLREMLPKLRKNLQLVLENRDKPMDRESINSQPMSEMGNYTNYKFPLHSVPPLREINPTPQRVDTFGNPFRKKSSAFVADEVFVDDTMPGVGPEIPQSSPRKRTSSTGSESRIKGPLSFDISFDNWRRSPRTPPSPIHRSESFESNSSDEMDIVEIPDNLIPKPINGIAVNGTIPHTSKVTRSTEFKRTKKTFLSKQSFDSNNKVLEEVICSIRKPIIDGAEIFNQLTCLKGPKMQRLACISVILSEAQRFKRTKLVELIKEYRCMISRPINSNQDKYKLGSGGLNGQS